MEDFGHPAEGLVQGISATHGPGIEPRLAFLEMLVDWEGMQTSWRLARASIADEDECPAYGGLDLEPQLGLLPIGRDPHSGYWEFAHLPSGAPALRAAASGRLDMTAESGLVLVLLPGGTFEMGANADSARPHFDADAGPMEVMHHRVTVGPFFLSKYEVTQGQWMRATGVRSAYYALASELVPHLSGEVLSRQVAATHPIESVSWSQARRHLARWGLVFCTEVQWEYACRANTPTIYYSGDDASSIFPHENLFDRDGAAAFHRRECAPFADGYAQHAPVGSFPANPFGLHDMSGNVSEYCRDFMSSYAFPVSEGEGERLNITGGSRVIRGASFMDLPAAARSARRGYQPQDQGAITIGLRPARRIVRQD